MHSKPLPMPMANANGNLPYHQGGQQHSDASGYSLSHHKMLASCTLSDPDIIDPVSGLIDLSRDGIRLTLL